MSDASNQGITHSRLDELYARVPQQDVEEFYASYSQWALQRRMVALEDAIASLRRQIDANSKQMHEAQPSAVALATLARLQANGVSDIELLDRMLERGEEWLDATMQRLDYCKQLDDFLSDDYEHWCRHALEGAYDWIDSLLRQAEEEAASEVNPTSASPDSTEETLSEATEERLLSKLSRDETEDEVASLEITVKRPAITPTELQSLASKYATPAARTEQVLSETGESAAFQAEPGSAEDSNISTSSEHDLPGAQEYITPEVASSEEDNSTTTDEQHVMQEFTSTDESFPFEDREIDGEEPALQEFAPAGETLPAEDREADGEEHSLQEFAAAAETSLTEDREAGSEEPVMQEFISIAEPVPAEEESAPAEEEAHSDAEETVIPEHDVPQELPIKEGNDSTEADLEQAEEPVKYEEAREDGNEVIPVQAVTTEESPATPQPPVPQWEWMAVPETNSSESQANTQENEPERRSNFLWRLLAKIWGR
jgi:hypothetical protein